MSEHQDEKAEQSVGAFTLAGPLSADRPTQPAHRAPEPNKRWQHGDPMGGPSYPMPSYPMPSYGSGGTAARPGPSGSRTPVDTRGPSAERPASGPGPLRPGGATEYRLGQ